MEKCVPVDELCYGLLILQPSGLSSSMRRFTSILTLAAALLGAAAAQAQNPTLFKPGTEFRDCAECPVMVVLPKASFMMGSPEEEKGRSKNEGPQRKVTIAYPLAVGKFEVTFDEWDACLAEAGCRGRRTERQGKERGQRPVTHVDWNDAQAFVKWLAAKTKMKYRLLSEAEWEYAARAGASTQYTWGAAPDRARANYGMDECCGGFVSGSDVWELAAPVGSFPPNAFGLHDLHGNLWEWVQDCWDENPATGPIDGGAREAGDCGLRIMRGGSWASMPVRIRAAFRDAFGPSDNDNFIGFRVARSE